MPLLLTGCFRDGYCISGCEDGDITADADAGTGDGGVDTGPPMGDSAICVPREPAEEICNDEDDDCNGNVDEGFDTMTDVRNCGECGNECLFVNADSECVDGDCVQLTCFDGFVDLDGEPGCEYACPVFPTVAEDCNGFDDDCDGSIDEAIDLPAPPAGLCRTTTGTPCEGTVAVCATREGNTTWFCDYAAEVEFDPVVPNGIVLDEARCDGFDGDCDGVRDESFAGLGDACDNGMRGACRDVGAIACDPADDSMTLCDLSVLPDATPGAPLSETCNGVDDNCDGIVDNPDPTDPDRVVDDMIHVTASGLDFWIYTHEASRPDATGTDAGTSSARACGRTSALPWTNVGFDGAEAACMAAGHRLCTAAEWLAACEMGTGATYPYGASYETATCNGADRDAIPGGGIDSQVEPTGALAMCVSPVGAFDMSGNVKEWSDDMRGTTSGGTPIYVVRGGSHDSPELGLTCATDLSRATADTLLPTLGFRCCDDEAP